MDAVVDGGIAVVASNTSMAVTSGLTIGATNTGSTAYVGVADNTLSAGGLLMGRDAGSAGFLSVGGGATVSTGLGSLDFLQVGVAGSGVLTISSGAQVDAYVRATLGVASTGSGRVVISGSGQLKVYSPFGSTLVVGDRGSGDLQVSGGGSVRGNDDFDLVIGDNGGKGTVSVSGSTSYIKATTLYAGYAGSSDISVEAGGALSASGTAYVRSITPGISSLLKADGTGSLVRAGDMLIGSGGQVIGTNDGFYIITDTLTMGGNGTGAATDATLELTNARLSAGGVVTSGTERSAILLNENGGLLAGTVALGAMTQLTMNLSGTTQAEHGFIDTTAMGFGGHLTLTLGPGYAPGLGDAYDLFDFTTGSGVFLGMDLPTLGVGLYWDTDALYTSGVVSVVPEPAMAGYAAVGLAGVAFARLRSRKLTALGYVRTTGVERTYG